MHDATDIVGLPRMTDEAAYRRFDTGLAARFMSRPGQERRTIEVESRKEREGPEGPSHDVQRAGGMSGVAISTT